MAKLAVDALWDGIGLALDGFPPNECFNYFLNAGYGSTLIGTCSSAEAQVTVPVTATMSLFTSVKPWRAAISVRAPIPRSNLISLKRQSACARSSIAARSAIPSTTAGLK